MSADVPTTARDTSIPAAAAPADAAANNMSGLVTDWGSDQDTFKNVPWGKAMMWIFLLSDTFIFGSFLTSYMTVRASTTVPWPNPSEVFALTMPAIPFRSFLSRS